MKLTNTQLENFINRIKFKKEKMPKYREQLDNLKEKVENEIKDDKRTLYILIFYSPFNF